jgi:hypothetical protein
MTDSNTTSLGASFNHRRSLKRETGLKTMAGEETAEVVADDKKRKVESTPPDGYVCRLCSTPGHWIQVCPTKKTGAKRQRKSDHVPVPGQDPSPDDIERAKELQKTPPPNCKSFGLCACAIIRCFPSFATSVFSFFRITGFCGIPSRLNKVKRSKEGGDNSRAVGTYFFFCNKKRDDETQCRFARPVEMELNKKRSVGDRTNEKTTGSKNGTWGDGQKAEKKENGKWGDGKRAEKKEYCKRVDNEKTENKPKLVCKFFAKNGSCKKGNDCEFSHDVQ